MHWPGKGTDLEGDLHIVVFSHLLQLGKQFFVQAPQLLHLQSSNPWKIEVREGKLELELLGMHATHRNLLLAL